MKLDLRAIQTMSKSNLIQLMEDAIKAMDHSAFWLLSGIFTGRLESSSPLAEALWKESHAENPNIKTAMRLIHDDQ